MKLAARFDLPLPLFCGSAFLPPLWVGPFVLPPFGSVLRLCAAALWVGFFVLPPFGSASSCCRPLGRSHVLPAAALLGRSYVLSAAALWVGLTFFLLALLGRSYVLSAAALLGRSFVFHIAADREAPESVTT